MFKPLHYKSPYIINSPEKLPIFMKISVIFYFSDFIKSRKIQSMSLFSADKMALLVLSILSCRERSCL